MNTNETKHTPMGLKCHGGRVEIKLKSGDSIALALNQDNLGLANEIVRACNEHAALVAVAQLWEEPSIFNSALGSISEQKREKIRAALSNLAAVRKQ